jgi:hypothetical protein
MIMINKIEALVDSVSHLNGSFNNPDSELYQIRSPLGLPSFSLPGKHDIDEKGRRVFKSWLAGYKASCADLEIKCSGKSRAGLDATDKLENLLRVLGFVEKLGQDQIIKFLRRALKNPDISRSTPLSYFIEDNK